MLPKLAVSSPLLSSWWLRHVWWLSTAALYPLLHTQPREHIWWWQGGFLVLFALYVWGLRQSQHYTPMAWLAIAAVFRLGLLVAFPVLSDDVYRFLWDGWVAKQGISPYSHTPEALAGWLPLPDYARTCFTHMNSPNYHSPYPVVLQALFFACSWEKIGITGSVWLMRLVQLVCELLLGYYLLRLLRAQRRMVWGVAALLWNPLVVMEGVGSLHAEMLMVWPWLAAVVAVGNRRPTTAAVYLGIAAAVKLRPLVSAPYLLYVLYRHRARAAVRFAGVLLLMMGVFGGLMWWMDGVQVWKGVALYGELFAFNSLYAVCVWAGPCRVAWWWMGAALGVSWAVQLWWVRRNQPLFTGVVVLYALYILGSSTVHPWYIIPLIGLAVGGMPVVHGGVNDANMHYGMLYIVLGWSYWVCWSYVGYTTAGYVPSVGVVLASYGALFGSGIWLYRRYTYKTQEKER